MILTRIWIGIIQGTNSGVWDYGVFRAGCPIEGEIRNMEIKYKTIIDMSLGSPRFYIDWKRLWFYLPVQWSETGRENTYGCRESEPDVNTLLSEDPHWWWWMSGRRVCCTHFLNVHPFWWKGHAWVTADMTLMFTTHMQASKCVGDRTTLTLKPMGRVTQSP